MKASYLVLATAITIGTASAEFRTWTRSDGKTANLDLVGTSGEGESLKGTFKMTNGKSIDLAVADLSEVDAELVREWKPEDAPAAENPSVSVFDEFLDGNLEKLDGRRLKRYELESKPTKYYLFYYTASWCPPCQKFTPSLVKFYDDSKPTSDEYEIILVTSDSDDGAMEDYAKDKGMNWPHLKLSKVEKFKKHFQHPGSGIPNLVLTDLEGNLIKTSYEGKKYLGPTSVMDHLAGLIK